MARLGRSYLIRPLTQIYNISISEIWYALYDVTTGELLSVGTVLPIPPDTIPAGTALLALTGQPDFTLILWDTTTRTFVPRPPPPLVDRAYDDLPVDASLAGVWAALDPTNTEALLSRIALLLGSWRYRLDFQNVDLD